MLEQLYQWVGFPVYAPFTRWTLGVAYMVSLLSVVLSAASSFLTVPQLVVGTLAAFAAAFGVYIEKDVVQRGADAATLAARPAAVLQMLERLPAVPGLHNFVQAARQSHVDAATAARLALRHVRASIAWMWYPFG